MLTKSSALAVCLLVSLTIFPSHGEDGKTSPTASVEYLKLIHPTAAGTVNVHVLKTHLLNSNVLILPALARGRIGVIERTSTISARHSATGAINASFFDREGVPLGMIIDLLRNKVKKSRFPQRE